MRAVFVVLAASCLVASAAQAQSTGPSHFTYTGALRAPGDVVAEADHVPLRSVRFVDDAYIDVSLLHPGLRLEARGERTGLQYHVHEWTEARAQGFTVYVAPETLVDVVEGSTFTRVIFLQDTLGVVTLGRAHDLPAWLHAYVEQETRLYTHCDATTLYARASEESESWPIEVGQTLYTQPARGGWQEAWARMDTHWVRGFARNVHCEAQDISGGLGFSAMGGSGFMEPPQHVLLPSGLRLVSPLHPRRVVLRVRVPVDVIAWAPGWTSANDEGALMIAFPCGVPDWTGHLTITSGQLVPEGAPPRTQ